MTANKLPVVAAIPNYNMGDSLAELLPQVLDQGYDETYVLDDASTDHSREVVEAYGSAVHFVGGAENVGAGGNRNRITDALGHKALIHFLDADMRLEGERTPQKVQELLEGPPRGFVGGLINNQDSEQFWWNFGPRQSLHTDMSAVLYKLLEKKHVSDPERATALRQRFSGILQGWPNIFEAPQAQHIFFAAEGNMAIASEVFDAVGGYDKAVKNHEVQDLAIRLAKAGLQRDFNPLLSATHTAVKVRSEKRTIARAKAELRIARKHGIHNWFLPNGHLKPEL